MTTWINSQFPRPDFHRQVQRHYGLQDTGFPLGPIRYGQTPGSIGVLEAIDKPMPIGEASCRTYDENGLAVWTLRTSKQEILGLWIVVDREFQPVK